MLGDTTGNRGPEVGKAVPAPEVIPERIPIATSCKELCSQCLGDISEDVKAAALDAVKLWKSLVAPIGKTRGA